SSNYPLTLDGDFTVAAGATFTARSGTTTFSSASAQSASSSNFYNLAHTGAGTLTINGTTTLSGTLINSAGTFDANYKRVAVTGPTNIAGGTYLARTSMSLLAGGLTVSGGTFTGSSGDVDVNDNLVLSSGTLTAPSGSFTVSGNWTKSGGTFTPGTGTTTFDGSGTQTITPDSSAFYNLAYEGSGTLSSAAALNASSSVTISSGTFDVSASNYPLILDGNFTVAAGATFTARSGTTTFSGSSAQTGSSTNYYNLYHQGSGTLTVSGTTTVSGNLTTDATVTRITSAMTLSGTSTNAGTILQVSPGRIIKPALSITLDKSAYDTSVDTSLTITLIDNDENVVGTTTDTTTITLTDGTDTETVTLTESGNQTFTFSGSITLDQTTVVVGDGTFQVAADGTITASYTDNEDPTDNLQTDMATVSVPATPTPTPTPESSPSTGGGGGILGMFGVVNSIPNLVTENVIEPIKEIAQEVVSVPVSFVRDLFGDEETPPPAESVTKESPLSLRDIWNLLPVEQINTFVFSPLPQSLALLSDQFPEFETTFEKLGVERMTDLDRLLGSNFVLPRIENIEEIPNEVVLTLHGVETEGIKTPRLLSFATFLDISKSGAITQRVNAISGQKLTFAVRPEHKAISVTGYIVLKESRFSDTNPNDLSFPVSSLAAGVILSGQEQGIVTDKLPKIEERLLLDKFTYQDPDGDGVYTAEVNAPMVASDFEVITVIDYEDPKLGNKELRFALVVDPEGYVYANVNGGQLRIEKAKVSIFVKDPQGRYILWPSEEFQQRNPQVTGTTGEYSFLVPTGEYYMSIEAKGYETYQGASFVVTEGSGVHENIELLPDNNLLQKFGWPWLLVMLVLLVILLLLAYNFYKDKQRTY
ncbi:MAG TPA: carboxypeptidase-like regulatory domain-containing protein, partial [Candidatus Paceibacterota bacterium]